MSSNKRKEAELRGEKEWESIDNAVIKSQSFLEKYGNYIFGAIGAFIIIACGYLAYQHFYVGPKTEEAQKAISQGQIYYESGLDSLALFGDANGYIGFEKVAKEFSSTSTGNLANAYAGICHARMGNYAKALDFLKSYNSSGDEVISHMVQGTIGDCLRADGKAGEAISYYEKAAKSLDNFIHSPLFYQKAANIYREQGKYDKVIEIYTLIKDQYMNSPIAMEADKYIEEANLLKAGK